MLYLALDVSKGPAADGKRCSIPQQAVETVTSQIEERPVEQKQKHIALGIAADGCRWSRKIGQVCCLSLRKANWETQVRNGYSVGKC